MSQDNRQEPRLGPSAATPALQTGTFPKLAEPFQGIKRRFRCQRRGAAPGAKHSQKSADYRVRSNLSSAATHPSSRMDSSMHLLYALADAFYRTFGITEPAEHARRRAAFFFLFLLLLVPVAIVLVAWLVAATMHR